MADFEPDDDDYSEYQSIEEAERERKAEAEFAEFARAIPSFPTLYNCGPGSDLWEKATRAQRFQLARAIAEALNHGGDETFAACMRADAYTWEKHGPHSDYFQKNGREWDVIRARFRKEIAAEWDARQAEQAKQAAKLRAEENARAMEYLAKRRAEDAARALEITGDPALAEQLLAVVHAGYPDLAECGPGTVFFERWLDDAGRAARIADWLEYPDDVKGADPAEVVRRCEEWKTNPVTKAEREKAAHRLASLSPKERAARAKLAARIAERIEPGLIDRKKARGQWLADGRADARERDPAKYRDPDIGLDFAMKRFWEAPGMKDKKEQRDRDYFTAKSRGVGAKALRAARKGTATMRARAEAARSRAAAALP